MSNIVGELITQELIVETSQRQRKKGGKPATDLELNVSGTSAVGLHLDRDQSWSTWLEPFRRWKRRPSVSSPSWQRVFKGTPASDARFGFLIGDERGPQAFTDDPLVQANADKYKLLRPVAPLGVPVA